MTTCQLCGTEHAKTTRHDGVETAFSLCPTCAAYPAQATFHARPDGRVEIWAQSIFKPENATRPVQLAMDIGDGKRPLDDLPISQSLHSEAPATSPRKGA